MRNPFFRLLKIALDYKWWMILASLIGFFTIGSSVGLMMTSAYIIAKAALHPSIAELQVAIVGVRFFGISRGIFRYAERYISHEVTFKLLAKFRVWFFKSIEPLVPSGVSKYKSGDLLTRSVADVENLEHIFVRVISPPIVALFILILMWFLFGIFSFSFSLIILFFFILGGIGVPLLTHFLSKNIGTKLVKLNTELNEIAIDCTQGISELLVFGRYKKWQNEYNTLNSDYINLQKKMASISGLHESLIGLTMNLAVIAILYIAIPFVNTGIMDGVYLSVLVIGTMAAFEAVLPLPTAVQFLEQSLKSAGRLFEITDEKPEIQNDNPQNLNVSDYSIRINDLHFGYNPSAPIYKGLTFDIPEKNFVALVGASGAGKSTLINLLLRFWNYNSGKIFLGNNEITGFNQEQISKYFAAVPQDTYLFNLPIEENIKLADPSASEQRVIGAAKMADLDYFINSLPNKYQEWVGEQGLKMSGGERQRVAIARAILKDAPIMIFDEPTSDLDALTERKILNTIYKLSEDKTVLLITHRLVGLDKADKILVMHNGQIIEEGKHADLVRKKGYYFHMLNYQNLILNE